MGLEITRIKPSELDSMQGEWNDLLRQSASDNVFMRWEWIHTWWTIFQCDRTLLILTVRSEGRLIGIAPFYIERIRCWGPRILKFCSEELSPDYMNIFAERGRESDVAAGIMDYLKRCSGEWDVMVLDNLSQDSILLSDVSLLSGFSHSARVSQTCPYIKNSGAFEDYYRSREQLLSFSLEKKYRKLVKQENAIHVTVRDEKDIQKSLDDFFKVHERASREKNVTSNLMAKDVQQFHRELCQGFFRDGILRLDLLYMGEKPLSAFYSFCYKNKLYCFNTGYDPEWKKRSVGGILLLLIVQQVFQDGLEEFDFLKGTEGYKSLWATGVRSEMRLTVFNRNWRGMFWLAADKAKSALRNGKLKMKSLRSRASDDA